MSDEFDPSRNPGQRNENPGQHYPGHAAHGPSQWPTQQIPQAGTFVPPEGSASGAGSFVPPASGAGSGGSGGDAGSGRSFVPPAGSADTFVPPAGSAGSAGSFVPPASSAGWSASAGPWAQPYPPYPPVPPRKRKGLLVGISAGVVVLSAVAGLAIGRFAWNNGTDANQAFGSVASPGSGTSASINPDSIAQKVDPGLVDINTVLGYQHAEAAGTGIVLTSNGEILTNNHVVEGATSISVTDIGNGKTYRASVVGYDRTKDIAVIQLQNASGLTTATLGDSSKVKTGDAVVGIGNAGGVGGTPSVAGGTVTALNQSITASDDSNSSSEQLTGLIETDANIQAGDSGGSLVNSAGQVIGVDTAASAGSSGGPDQAANRFGQGSQGNQGYAIPINEAISLAHQIIGGHGSTTIHIGQSAFLGVSVSGTGQGGAQIVGLLTGGAAQQAGLVAGDVITSVNGTTIDSATTLTNLMDTFHPGNSLSIGYTDTAGQQHTVTVTVANGPVG